MRLLLVPLCPVKRDFSHEKDVMKAAIGHVLADEHGVFSLEATTQEGNQVAMASGTDDPGFVEERLLGTHWTNLFGDKLLYGNNCTV